MASLLFDSSHSTDFEVHRNWLAITYSTSPSQWYEEATSQWTLDYPPLFAAGEWFLAQFASYINPEMLVLSKDPYVSSAVIIFQRCSVLITEFVLIFAVHSFSAGPCIGSGGFILFLEGENIVCPVFLSVFPMFLNHITCTDMHFQYNGFLFGVLFLSVAKVFQSNYLFAGFLFACLLNLKHIFLCLAPVYFVFILLHYCFQTGILVSFNYLIFQVNDKCHFRFDRFLLMGLTVCSVFSISIGPWVYMVCTSFYFTFFHFTLLKGKFQSLLSRLFPFHRGLCHAYWAPNFWALYNTLDKLLDLSGKFPEYCMGKAVLSTTTAVEGNFVNMTSGLTGDYVHACLPTIRPLHTAIITLIFVLPSLLICKRCSNPSDADNPQVLGCILLRAVAAAAWAAFLFSWHVHEKAILMVTLPLLLLAVVSRKLRGLAFYVTTLAHFSLLPLIFTSAEQPAVLSTYLAFTVAQYSLLGRMSPLVYTGLLGRCWPVLSSLACVHLLGLLPFLVFVRVFLPLRYPAYQFLPLMLTSVYTAIGLFGAFLVYIYVNMQWTFARTEVQANDDQEFAEFVSLQEKKRN
ncbi:unnamed protein product [Schistocephalus solidus]|uniref:Alpha-1,3-glucosyltransferase n=2 Tax=Schistocephalus solidus TaxID=70667 RepID=A0A3P7D0E9_SCHSO|nr:unnamed protein product [Schistocephalus solidus]